MIIAFAEQDWPACARAIADYFDIGADLGGLDVCVRPSNELPAAMGDSALTLYPVHGWRFDWYSNRGFVCSIAAKKAYSSPTTSGMPRVRERAVLVVFLKPQQ
jgi:hypothetical protein